LRRQIVADGNTSAHFAPHWSLGQEIPLRRRIFPLRIDFELQSVIVLILTIVLPLSDGPQRRSLL